MKILCSKQIYYHQSLIIRDATLLIDVSDHLRLRRFRVVCPLGEEGSMLMSGARRSVNRR
jgi:hypothetical protein